MLSKLSLHFGRMIYVLTCFCQEFIFDKYIKNIYMIINYKEKQK
jgi:hypothetical protein